MSVVVEHLLLRALRFLRSKKYSQLPGAINVAGVRISELQPLGGYHYPGVTKAGRLSFAGVCDGRRVKVYSGYSAAQNLFRKELQALSFESCAFPEIIAVDDKLVVEAWIDGVPVSRLDKVEQRIAAQAVSHFWEEARSREDVLELAERHRDSFCYFRDYLVARIGVWQHWEPVAEFLALWEREFSRLSGSLPVRLSHPDLSASNLVKDSSSGRIVVIDNELIGIGCGWILDSRNSLLGEYVPVDSSASIPLEFVDLCWRLRQLGTALDAGDFSKATAICMVKS